MANGKWINCHRCNVQYYLPPDLYTAARSTEKISFWCPYGHSAHFPAGPTKKDELRRERDRLKQLIAREQDETTRQRKRAEASERSATAYKGQATRLRNRAKAGVCPCCTRHFVNLERHIKSKHPAFAPAPDLKVIVGGKRTQEQERNMDENVKRG